MKYGLNIELPFLNDMTSVKGQVRSAVRGIERELGKNCDIDPELVLGVLELNGVEITKEEVKDALLEILK